MPDLKSLIRTIPDYPKKGIMFRDVTTLMGNARGFKAAIERMAAPYAGAKVQAVAGIEADRKSTRLNSSHIQKSRMPSSA